ncbi:MAG: ribonuclease D [Pseudomonadota bacterium]
MSDNANPSAKYHLIASQDELAATCSLMAQAPYVTVDTEFMRERTYWPQLCLVQLARPLDDSGQENAVIIDPLADLDLTPLFDLMRDTSVLKVFHAARQDVEIFVKLMGDVPQPLFDTQIAAMVCGYGDQVGYETLVKSIVKQGLDKSSRFTDWARRPLSAKQLSYAVGDVTHLRVIYEKLAADLAGNGRTHWVSSETDTLNARETYVIEPKDAWQRLKTRSTDGRFLGVARALAEWREREAQGRDVPRGRILKDDAVLEIAAARPTTREQLLASRSLQREGRKSETCEAILAVVQEGLSNPVRNVPEPPRKHNKQGGQAVAELLRVLLKARADDLGVAQRLIASASDLDELVYGDEDIARALKGWRREAFGDDALRLKRGEIGLAVGRKGVRVIPLQQEE